MVHKRTQYSLSFPILSNDLRTQIWQDNYKFRENCKATNQSDHYWDYQVSFDKCDCDNVDNIDEDSSSISLNKLKHKRLLELYERNKTESSNRSYSLNTLQINSPHPKNKDSDSNEKKSLEIIPVNSNDGCILKKNKNISVNNLLSKKSKVFVPFGWNDTNKDIGKKKTFNIKAPEKEVYPHAIMKTKQNRKIIELPKHKKIQKRIQPPTIWEFNNDIIWTTEYREKFSKKSS